MTHAVATAVPTAHGVFFDWSYTAPGPLRIVLALLMLVVTIAVAGRRIAWLVKLIRSGQPAEGRTDKIGERLRVQVEEVFGQKRLLKWSAPGLAHFFTFWGFDMITKSRMYDLQFSPVGNTAMHLPGLA